MAAWHITFAAKTKPTAALNPVFLFPLAASVFPIQKISIPASSTIRVSGEIIRVQPAFSAKESMVLAMALANLGWG